MPNCYSCGQPVDAGDRVGRTDTCAGCGADLHCCLNCRFHDPGSYNQCCEPQAERVVDKERSNFCDFFSFSRETAPAAAGAAKKTNPLDGIFKK